MSVLGTMIADLPTTGGFSYSPSTGSAPADGYMIALTGYTARFPAEILDDPEVAAKVIVDYLMTNRAIFEGSGLYVGGWIEDGQLWIEPSVNVADLAAAVELGRSTDQIAIYDVANGAIIDTGGNGGFLS